MSLDSLYLVEQSDHFFLFDRNSCKPVMLSKMAYEVLSAYKNGVDIQKLYEHLGEKTVKSILDGLSSLIGQKVVLEGERDFYLEAETVISECFERDISLLEGVFMVSQACNLACRYCYGGDSGGFGSEGLMSREVAEEFFRYFLSCGKGKSFQKVIFFGGEPLLNLDVIKYIIGLWEKWKPMYEGRELYFAMTTNGTLLTPDIVEYLIEKEVRITISLDGPRDIHDTNRLFANGHGTFDKVMQGIDILRKYNVPISVRATVTRDADLDQIYAFFEEQNFHINYIVPVDYPLMHPEKDYQMDLDTFCKCARKEQQLVQEGCMKVLHGDKDSFKSKQMSMAYHNINSRVKYPFKCGAGWWMATFSHDGYIYPCQRFTGREPFRIGDIQQGVDKEKVAAMYTKFLDASKSCNSCWAVPLCQFRCFHQKSTEAGDFEQIPEEICDVYRENFANAVVFSSKLQKLMKENKQEINEAIIRYDADNVMNNIKLKTNI